MGKLHLLTSKEELRPGLLPGKVVVVLDVLFATSSIATALAHGATEVVPSPDAGSARAEAARRPAGSCLLAGELHAELLPGMEPPFPTAIAALPLAGRALVYSTTNGTVALHRAAGAERVYAASLLNGRAVAEHLLREGAGSGRTVLLACAGSGGSFSLEDFYGAGYLVSLLLDSGLEPSDAALAALRLHGAAEPLECLAAGRVGRMMAERGLGHEVAFAARKDALPVVPLLQGGALRRAT